MRVVALDLSLRATGIAATCDGQGRPRLSCRTVEAAKGDRPTVMDHKRVHAVFSACRAATAYAELVVIEWLPRIDLGDHSLRLAELHGVVKHYLWSKRIPYVDVQPQHLKIYATGNGGADKDAVRAEVIARYGRQLHVSSHDEADATALVALALHAFGQPLAEVPETHRRALDSYQWPTLARSA